MAIRLIRLNLLPLNDMKEITQVLGFSFFLGLLFMVFGLLLYYFPPKNRNIIYGYRTQSSLKTPESWAFSQPYAGLRMLVGGAVTMILSIAIHVGDFRDNFELTAEIILVVGLILYVFITTEAAIKKRFGQ